MAYLDHTAAYQDFRDRILDGIKSHFPDGKIEGKAQTLHLDGLEVQEGDLHADDIRAQHKAKVEGHTWSAPVVAKLTLKDNTTGKVVDSRKVRIAEIPRVTRRHSYILDGQEYQVDNQWQLKPGVYTRRKQTGELEAQFNTPNQAPFKVNFDPGSKVFTMERGSSKSIPLYPLMKSMGVDDDTMEREWGKETLEANRKARGAATALDKFYKADKRGAPPDKETAEKYFVETMQSSELRPESTALTLGKPYSNIDGDVFRRATGKILKVQGGAPEDDRDSLEFKDLRSAGDFAQEKLTNYKVQRTIRDKAARKINQAKNVRDIVKFDMFNEPIRQTFHKNSLSQVPDQTNPVEMLAAAQQTTIMGPGGIKSENTVVDEAKFINPSHLGYLDPIKTPEGSKTGITLRLPMGVRKKGKEPVIPLYNLRTGKVEEVGPQTFARSKVVLPDQVKWDSGKPVSIAGKVKVSTAGNDIDEIPMKDAQYVMRHPSQLFNVTSNLIPYMANTSGNRTSYAGQHIEQAISLANREEPLVQVGTGSKKEGISTFEELLGRQSGHPSPVSGEVTRVTKNGVFVKDVKGKEREVQLYNNFPLNDAKAVIDSTPTVKVGDKVKAGQSVADTNFTKNGKLALGTNLRVAYIPFKGYNYEDGVVVSESAANKLASVHMHKPNVQVDDKTITSPKKFAVQHPEAFTKEQYAKLDENGAVRIGQKVQTGDPLIVAMKPYQLKDRMGLGAIRRSLSGQHTDASLRWDSDYPGEVVGVHKKGKEVSVHVRTLEPMQVGDKLSGRHGNKGVVTMVLPDKQMPHTKDGNPIEIALNPSGVPGRMNTGQVLETAVSKIAEKTKKPYIVNNFEQGNVLQQVKKDLKKHGLSDTEELVDPETGVTLGKSLVGKQYILKLKHQVDKKISARAGMGLPGSENEPERYDFNLMPVGGAKVGGQSMGHLGMGALLAHGAKANIREMQTWKSEGPDPQQNESKRWASQHTDVWNAIQTGTPLPPPKHTFAFAKFTNMLKAAGINIEKKGHQMQLLPMTDKQVKEMSAGALPKPSMLTYPKVDKNGEPKPITGGLFDPKLTGGHGGKKWTHMKLAEPMPNPVYEGAIQKVLGLGKKDYEGIVNGEMGVDKHGAVVPLGTTGALTGGTAIESMLKRIDVKKDLASAEKELSGMTVPASVAHGTATPKVDKLLKKVKYLRALDQMGAKPNEAYVMRNLPVIPPAMRPASVLSDGNIKWADLNGLYSQFAQLNGQLSDPTLSKSLTDEGKKRLRRDMYDGMKALMGTITTGGDGNKGILQQIHGSQPKQGYFQKTLMNRRQDLTMRSVIAPEPALGLDEVGLPEKKAMTLYRPFVVRKMVEMGSAAHPLEAQKMMKDGHPSARRALEYVTEERPVIIKRDPALHKHNVQAYKPKLVKGRAIQIHPLMTSGFNADFDGDTMSAYVPISREAVEEAHKMFPSNNLFNDATGKAAYQPTLESALGLYKLSLSKEGTPKKVSSAVDALKQVQAGKLTVNSPIKLGKTTTTPGRVLLADAVPTALKQSVLSGSEPIDKKGLSKLFGTIAKDHPTEFADAANKLKDLGYGASYGAVAVASPQHQGAGALYAKENAKKHIQYIPTGTHSLSLDDFEPDTKTRDPILAQAQKKVDAIKKMTGINKRDVDRRVVDVWASAAQKMEAAHKKKMAKNPNNLAIMNYAGVKPSFDQYKQMVLAPVLVSDASGKLVPRPIKSSYSEGMDTADYWTQMSGARRGSVMKVQEVRDPGYFSKQLINTTMNLVVNGEDCGTSRGVSMSATSSDVMDRQLARDFRAKNVQFGAGTTLTPDVVSKIRAADKNAQLIVRSPLKCEHGKGLCQKCAGLAPTGKPYELGTNIGVLAAQALGERSTQLAMKAFHSGGVQTSGGNKLINQFGRVEQLTRLPKDIPDSAALAMRSGTVDKVEKDRTGMKVWVSGKVHHIGKDRTGMPLYEDLPHANKVPGYTPWKAPRVGMKVEAGQSLSDPNRTVVNPHQLYRATNNMERVQNYLTDELHKIYGAEGVRKQHVETAVKAMSNLTKVRDPGDADHILRGEFQPHSQIRAMNTQLVKQGKKPVQHSPILQGIDMMPLSVQEDWMAKLMHNRLRSTLQESAAIGATSNIHGLHPIPGAAYGAEFGLTSRHSAQPGLGKLKDVPGYGY